MFKENGSVKVYAELSRCRGAHISFIIELYFYLTNGTSVRFCLSLISQSIAYTFISQKVFPREKSQPPRGFKPTTSFISAIEQINLVKSSKKT